jgi:hypothetical protein
MTHLIHTMNSKNVNEMIKEYENSVTVMIITIVDNCLSARLRKKN